MPIGTIQFQSIADPEDSARRYSTLAVDVPVLSDEEARASAASPSPQMSVMNIRNTNDLDSLLEQLEQLGHTQPLPSGSTPSANRLPDHLKSHTAMEKSAPYRKALHALQKANQKHGYIQHEATTKGILRISGTLNHLVLATPPEDVVTKQSGKEDIHTLDLRTTPVSRSELKDGLTAILDAIGENVHNHALKGWTISSKKEQKTGEEPTANAAQTEGSEEPAAKRVDEFTTEVLRCACKPNCNQLLDFSVKAYQLKTPPKKGAEILVKLSRFYYERSAPWTPSKEDRYTFPVSKKDYTDVLLASSSVKSKPKSVSSGSQ